MTYHDALDYLYAHCPAFTHDGAAAFQPGLARANAWMEHLAQPHKKFRTIHIAGTNGKGSTAHLIAAVLQCAGYKVGLFTSPHLVDFRERIRLNGKMIPQDAVSAFVQENKRYIAAEPGSFFITTMALAFDFFAREGVDVAVIEAGLGGRADSTNIITPLLSIITNVGLDHTDILGGTLDEIAWEKAGIIKQGVPCVVGERTEGVMHYFLKKAQQCGILNDGLETTNTQLFIAEDCEYLRRKMHRIVPFCELQGGYEQKNMLTAYVALAYLQGRKIFGISNQNIADGYARVCTLTGLQGRWQIVQKPPYKYIFDTGHNAHALRLVFTQLREVAAARLHIVFGMVKDKDIRAVVPLMPQDATYYFTQPHSPRAFPAVEWLLLMRSHNPQSACTAFSEVSAALNSAQQNAQPQDIIFVGGSNYVVGEALKMIL